MSANRHYHATLEHHWKQAQTTLSDMEVDRIRATISMIPDDVTTILDVGCGDGRILGRLPDRYTAVGVDHAASALVPDPRGRIRASSERLPFRSGSFDLVLCSEVLEHLPDALLASTVRELVRVSRRHILVSVPYRENRRLHYARCERCSTVFHVWGHLRSFSTRSLDRLFPGYQVRSTVFFGHRERYYNRAVLWVNQHVGGRWADWERDTMCPACGATTCARTPRNLVTMACGAVNLVTERLVPVSAHGNWLLRSYAVTS